MKILSYNLNGIRAAMRKDLTEYLKQQNPDIICFQELKANEEQIEVGAFEDLGYHCHWHSAEKKGYSGVGLLSKEKPSHVAYGCGEDKFDSEGRILRADFKDLSVVSAYFPSGTTGDVRQDVKYEFLEYMDDYIPKLLKKHPKLVLSGDYNIANAEIDIHNPKGNKNTSGFLPEEREWLTKFFQNGMKDSFRQLNPETEKYSWWSYRARAREKNKGWRLDYHAVSDELMPNVKQAFIDNDAVHSDHCPVGVVID